MILHRKKIIAPENGWVNTFINFIGLVQRLIFNSGQECLGTLE